MATYQYLDGTNADGTILGQSATASYVGFFAKTPVVQPTSANQAAVATTAATSAGGLYGFSSAQANGIITLLNQIRSDLVNLGLIKGS